MGVPPKIGWLICQMGKSHRSKWMMKIWGAPRFHGNPHKRRYDLNPQQKHLQIFNNILLLGLLLHNLYDMSLSLCLFRSRAQVCCEPLSPTNNPGNGAPATEVPNYTWRYPNCHVDGQNDVLQTPRCCGTLYKYVQTKPYWLYDIFGSDPIVQCGAPLFSLLACKLVKQFARSTVNQNYSNTKINFAIPNWGTTSMIRNIMIPCFQCPHFWTTLPSRKFSCASSFRLRDEDLV